MVKTKLELAWDDFVHRVNDIFVFGHDLPLCLHPSAVDVIGRKMESWKQEIDHYGKGTIVSEESGIFRYDIEPEGSQSNALKLEYEIVNNSSVPSQDTKEAVMYSTEEESPSSGQICMTHFNLKQIKQDLDVVVKNEGDKNRIKGLVFGDCAVADTTEETPKGSTNQTEENETRLRRSTRSKGVPKKNEDNNDNSKSNWEEIDIFDQTQEVEIDLEPPMLSDTFDDIDSDSCPVEENHQENNPVQDAQPESEFFTVPEIKKGVKRRKCEDKKKKQKCEPKVKKRVGRPPKAVADEPVKKSFFCDICSKGFTTEDGLLQHKDIHINGPRKCKECGKVYHSKSGYFTHMRTHKNAYKCPHCDYLTGGKTWLERHILQVHKKDDPQSRPYLCDLCGDSFAAGNALKRHRQHHTREKVYKCNHCSHVTHTSDNLRAHIRNVHTERDKFVCNICGDEFKYKNSLQDHEKRHYSAKPFKCPECDYRTVSKNILSKHRKVHTDRSHQCDICKKFFSTKDHVRRHRVTHTGEKQFGCFFCSYKCNVKGNLKKHLKNVHKHIPPSMSKRVTVIDKVPPETLDTEAAIPAEDHKHTTDCVVMDISTESAVASTIIAQESIHIGTSSKSNFPNVAEHYECDTLVVCDNATVQMECV